MPSFFSPIPCNERALKELEMYRSQTFPDGIKMPSVAKVVLRVSYVGFFFYRTISKLEFRRSNPTLYLGGVFLNAEYGDVPMVKVAAQVLLVARVFLNIIEDSAKVLEGWKRVVASFSSREKCTDLFLDTQKALLKKNWHGEDYSLEKNEITWRQGRDRIWTFLQDVGRLISRFYELYDAVFMNPHTQAAAIDDIFLEVKNMKDTLDPNHKRLAYAVGITFQESIDKALHLLDINSSSEEIARRLEKNGEKVCSVFDGCSGVLFSVEKMIRATKTVLKPVIFPSRSLLESGG